MFAYLFLNFQDNFVLSFVSPTNGTLLPALSVTAFSIKSVVLLAEFLRGHQLALFSIYDCSINHQA